MFRLKHHFPAFKRLQQSIWPYPPRYLRPQTHLAGPLQAPLQICSRPRTNCPEFQPRSPAHGLSTARPERLHNRPWWWRRLCIFSRWSSHQRLLLVRCRRHLLQPQLAKIQTTVLDLKSICWVTPRNCNRLVWQPWQVGRISARQSVGS